MVKEYTKKKLNLVKEIQIIMFIKCVQHLKYFFFKTLI